MKHLIWFGVVLAIALSVMPAAPAKAERFPDNSYYYLIKNQGSQLCLQPWYEAPINGLTIVQLPCNQYNLYQRWIFVPNGGDNSTNPVTPLYLIVNTGSGQCLDDRDGKTANGSPVQQWPCNWGHSASTTMVWRLGDHFPYGAELKNERSGKCLDVRAGSSTPGTLLQIYQCTSATNSPNYAQLFSFPYGQCRVQPDACPAYQAVTSRPLSANARATEAP
jgi:hypothetical protein